MFNFNADQQEIDLAYDYILKVILGAVILKLDMKAVFDADFHFNTIVDLGNILVDVNPKILLEREVRYQTTLYG